MQANGVINTVLLDLDGVVRHFDPARVGQIEQKYELAAGRLLSVAFEDELLTMAITGQISREEWTARIGEIVGSPSAAEEWLTGSRGTVDPEMLAEVADLRSRGVVVAVLTNGTSTIPDEMRELGLVNKFDAIFNTFDIGYAKPDRRAFEHVCRELAIEPASVFFTDDSPTKLVGAQELGMTVRHFVDVLTFRQHLNEVGLAS